MHKLLEAVCPPRSFKVKSHSAVMQRLARLAVASVAVLGGAGATELTKENWDEAVAGKTVFVKFLAPW